MNTRLTPVTAFLLTVPVVCGAAAMKNTLELSLEQVVVFSFAVSVAFQLLAKLNSWDVKRREDSKLAK